MGQPWHEARGLMTRRALFGRSALGVGTAALASLLVQDGRSAGADEATKRPAGGRRGGLPGVPHFAPKAKRVIYLLQNGAPTHVDL